MSYIFDKSVEEQFAAFNTGFHKVCGGRVLVSISTLICISSILSAHFLLLIPVYQVGFFADLPCAGNTPYSALGQKRKKEN